MQKAKIIIRATIKLFAKKKQSKKLLWEIQGEKVQ